MSVQTPGIFYLSLKDFFETINPLLLAEASAHGKDWSFQGWADDSLEWTETMKKDENPNETVPYSFDEEVNENGKIVIKKVSQTLPVVERIRKYSKRITISQIDGHNVFHFQVWEKIARKLKRVKIYKTNIIDEEKTKTSPSPVFKTKPNSKELLEEDFPIEFYYSYTESNLVYQCMQRVNKSDNIATEYSLWKKSQKQDFILIGNEAPNGMTFLPQEGGVSNDPSVFFRDIPEYVEKDPILSMISDICFELYSVNNTAKMASWPGSSFFCAKHQTKGVVYSSEVFHVNETMPIGFLMSLTRKRMAVSYQKMVNQELLTFDLILAAQMRMPPLQKILLTLPTELSPREISRTLRKKVFVEELRMVVRKALVQQVEKVVLGTSTLQFKGDAYDFLKIYVRTNFDWPDNIWRSWTIWLKFEESIYTLHQHYFSNMSYECAAFLIKISFLLGLQEHMDRLARSSTGTESSRRRSRVNRAEDKLMSSINQDFLHEFHPETSVRQKVLEEFNSLFVTGFVPNAKPIELGRSTLQMEKNSLRYLLPPNRRLANSGFGDFHQEKTVLTTLVPRLEDYSSFSSVIKWSPTVSSQVAIVVMGAFAVPLALGAVGLAGTGVGVGVAAWGLWLIVSEGAFISAYPHLQVVTRLLSGLTSIMKTIAQVGLYYGAGTVFNGVANVFKVAAHLAMWVSGWSPESWKEINTITGFGSTEIYEIEFESEEDSRKKYEIQKAEKKWNVRHNGILHLLMGFGAFDIYGDMTLTLADIGPILKEIEKLRTIDDTVKLFEVVTRGSYLNKAQYVQYLTLELPSKAQSSRKRSSSGASPPSATHRTTFIKIFKNDISNKEWAVGLLESANDSQTIEVYCSLEAMCRLFQHREMASNANPEAKYQLFDFFDLNDETENHLVIQVKNSKAADQFWLFGHHNQVGHYKKVFFEGGGYTPAPALPTTTTTTTTKPEVNELLKNPKYKGRLIRKQRIYDMNIKKQFLIPLVLEKPPIVQNLSNTIIKTKSTAENPALNYLGRALDPTERESFKRIQKIFNVFLQKDYEKVSLELSKSGVLNAKRQLYWSFLQKYYALSELESVNTINIKNDIIDKVLQTVSNTAEGEKTTNFRTNLIETSLLKTAKRTSTSTSKKHSRKAIGGGGRTRRSGPRRRRRRNP